MNYKTLLKGFLAASFCLAAASTSAATLFSDDFDGETAGLNASLTQWNITDGTVDVIDSGGFGISCVGSAGRCIDLDGTSGNAARIETMMTFNLSPGDYVLSFALSGNQRGASSNDTVDIFFDALALDTITLPFDAPFATFAIPFTLSTAANGRIIFDHAGGDNIGLILDNVRLDSEDITLVSEPATLILFGIGAFGLVGYAWRRKRIV